MRISSIQLKNHDDSIQVLTDVRYIPSLKKNLISLGVLEFKGHTITLRNGFLKVLAGALTVIKDTRRNNLYYFQESTIIVLTSTISKRHVDSETTKLWHMRLGYTGKKKLQILVKQDLLKGANSCKLKFCALGKKKRIKFGSAIHDTKGIMDMFIVMWGDLPK